MVARLQIGDPDLTGPILRRLPLRGLAPHRAAPADRAGARHGPAAGGDLEEDVDPGRELGFDGLAAFLGEKLSKR